MRKTTNTDRLIKLCEFSDFRNVQDFFRVMNNYDYSTVGGFAVAYYVKKRIPSKGDIDVLINADDYDYIADELTEDGWKVLKKGLKNDFEFADATRNGDMFDILLDEFGILERSRYKRAVFNGVSVKLMSPEWIIALKLMAGREKDLQDVVLLLQSKLCDDAEVERAVIEVLGEEWLDELESLQYMAQSLQRYLKHERR